MPAMGDGEYIFAGMARSYGNVFPCLKIGLRSFWWQGRRRKLKTGAPVTLDEIFDRIDSMPMRKEEMRRKD